jgi:hypothetical protein
MKRRWTPALSILIQYGWLQIELPLLWMAEIARQKRHERVEAFLRLAAHRKQ